MIDCRDAKHHPTKSKAIARRAVVTDDRVVHVEAPAAHLRMLFRGRIQIRLHDHQLLHELAIFTHISKL